MSWLIGGLFALVVVSGLVMLILWRGRHRHPADETLISDLLGPPDGPVPSLQTARQDSDRSPSAPVAAMGDSGPSPSASVALTREGSEPRPAASVALAREHGQLSSSPPAVPAGEGDWLEAQLSWITAWSQQMHRQITSAGRPEPDRNE